MKGSRGPGFKGSSDPPQNRRIKMLKNYDDDQIPGKQTLESLNP
jgi:hypothetical protein